MCRIVVSRRRRDLGWRVPEGEQDSQTLSAPTAPQPNTQRCCHHAATLPHRTHCFSTGTMARVMGANKETTGGAEFQKQYKQIVEKWKKGGRSAIRKFLQKGGAALWAPLQLQRAAREGHKAIVREMLAAGANGAAGLCDAVKAGDMRVAEQLIAAGVDVSAADTTQSGARRTPLSVAASACNQEAVELLLAAGASVPGADSMLQDSIYCSMLYTAVRQRWATVVPALLAAGAAVNLVNREGESALHVAVARAPTTVSALLAAGADVDAADRRGRTPLMLAAQISDAATVSALLAGGADVDAADTRGRTPLMLATEMGRAATVSALIAAGGSVCAVDSEGRSALHYAGACWQGSATGVMSALIAAGCLVSAVDRRGRSALHIACKRGLAPLVQLLLEAGADTDVCDPQTGRAPLHSAIAHGHTEAAQLLLAAGAAVDVKDKEGRTPLHYVNRDEALAAALIAAGASVSVHDNNGRTPLFSASSAAVITALLAAGAAVSAADCTGCTPLMHAVSCSQTEVMSALIAAGASVSETDKLGNTLMHRAASCLECDAAMSALFKAGASVSVTNTSGSTPLHVAASYGQVKTAKFLLKHGASASAADSSGRTPLHEAVTWQLEEGEERHTPENMCDEDPRYEGGVAEEQGLLQLGEGGVCGGGGVGN